MERVRALALDELLRERVAAGVPVIGLCMGMQLLFESTTELGGAEGIGLLRGPVERLDAPEGPADRLERGGLAAQQRAQRGAARPVRLLPRELVRAAARATARTCSGRPTTAASSSAWSSGRRSTALQSHPEKSGPDGLRLLKNFVRLAQAIRVEP